MATKVTVGHSVALAIAYLDTNGNPMLVTPTPDAPAQWTHSADATIDTLTVAADGNSASVATLAAGADTVSLALAVAGAAFTASLAIEIDAVPQVLGSIQIVATVS